VDDGAKAAGLAAGHAASVLGSAGARGADEPPSELTASTEELLAARR
jgi:hypothetical protein